MGHADGRRCGLGLKGPEGEGGGREAVKAGALRMMAVKAAALRVKATAVRMKVAAWTMVGSDIQRIIWHTLNKLLEKMHGSRRWPSVRFRTQGS